jgi:hypothetical protein
MGYHGVHIMAATSLTRDDGCYGDGMTTVVSFVSLRLWFIILISLSIHQHNNRLMNFQATMVSMLESKL